MEARPSLASSLEKSSRHMGHSVLPASHRESRVFRFLPIGSFPSSLRRPREVGDAGVDVLIACAFNYEAYASEFDRLGRIPILKARMNADLHMAGELKSTGKGNLFVIFGEPEKSFFVRHAYARR